MTYKHHEAAKPQPKRTADVPVRSGLASSEVVEVSHNPHHAQPLRTWTSAVQESAPPAKTYMDSITESLCKR